MAPPRTYRFRADLWRHSGDAAWHFLTLPHEEADEIEEISAPTPRGFGSVPVRVTIGSSSWNTSLFPDAKAASYVLPVKKPVRIKEGLNAGETVEVTLELA